jgi:hypothetical protein
MIYDLQESDTEENPPELEVFDQDGTPLGEDDVDPLDMGGISTGMEEGDFEVLA